MKKPSLTIRIDPLTFDGRFDTDFYSCEEYQTAKAKVLWYLKEEGFDVIPNTYFLYLYNHCWQIEIKSSK